MTRPTIPAPCIAASESISVRAPACAPLNGTLILLWLAKSNTLSTKVMIDTLVDETHFFSGSGHDQSLRSYIGKKAYPETR